MGWMPEFKSWVAGFLAILTWLLLHMQNDFAPDDVLFPPPDINTTVEQHFTETYYQARALFRQRAKDAGAELYALPLVNQTHLNLSVDVAILHGAKDKLIVHMSGTHGVEGFAGSAIQSVILQQWSSHHTKNTEMNNAVPTVVFVHAVNPYGFSMLRRVNEHNVDLNRNWLSDAQFKKSRDADPKKNGYMDVHHLLNPTADPYALENWFWPRVVYELATRGFNTIKQAAVSGNYHMPQTIFYGGDRMQPSLVALQDFLKTHFNFPAITSLAVVDVHTGLGRSGEDTLMLMPSTTSGVAERVFAQEFRAKNIASVTDATNPVAQGYAEVAGYVAQGVAELLPISSSTKVVACVQEFGTVPGVFVLKATIQENAYFQHARAQRLPYAERLRDVFYTHGSASWKHSVLARGVAVFTKLQKHLTSSSA